MNETGNTVPAPQHDSTHSNADRTHRPRPMGNRNGRPPMRGGSFLKTSANAWTQNEWQWRKRRSKPKEKSWKEGFDELMKDPEFKKEMKNEEKD